MSPIRRALYYAARSGCIPNKKAEPHDLRRMMLEFGALMRAENRLDRESAVSRIYRRVRSLFLFADLRFHHSKPSTTTTTQMRILSSKIPLTSLRAYFFLVRALGGQGLHELDGCWAQDDDE